MIPDYPDLTEAQQRENGREGYLDAIRALRLAGIREGKYEPIQSDEEEMRVWREGQGEWVYRKVEKT